MIYMKDGECIFRCKFCGNDNTTESYPVVQELYFNPHGEYIGCDCCGVHTENADDFAARMCEEMDAQAREERYYE